MSERRSLFPEIQNIVQAIDLERNCLVLNLNHPDAAKVRETIQAIDKRPQVIRLDTVLSLIAADGREKVLSRPTMYTLPGKTEVFWMGEFEGAKLKLTVTPSLVETSP